MCPRLAPLRPLLANRAEADKTTVPAIRHGRFTSDG